MSSMEENNQPPQHEQRGRQGSAVEKGGGGVSGKAADLPEKDGPLSGKGGDDVIDRMSGGANPGGGTEAPNTSTP